VEPTARVSETRSSIDLRRLDCGLDCEYQMSRRKTGDAPGWAERDEAVVWHGFTQMAHYAEVSPVVVERAEGRYLVDTEGRRYFDGISSLWVNTLGHNVPELDRALRQQLDRVAHSTMLGGGNRIVIELAEALAGVLPVDSPHLLFASDGASAVEQALKIAFQYWVNSGISDRISYMALGNAYHGDTVGSLSLGDGGFGTDLFDPLRFAVVRTPGYDDPGWLQKAVATLEAHADELAAVVLEPVVQGASGMLVADPHDVDLFGRACAEAGVLLVADEVATGFGRTTRLFASDWCGLRPDLMCLGKGITGGYLPMSVTAASGQVFEAFLGADPGRRTFFHGHSYGGNALGASVALEHLRLIDRWDVLGQATSGAELLGRMLDSEVSPHRAVAEVRRFGLMVGVDLATREPGTGLGRRVCAGATRRGVLLRPLGDTVVLMPPLTSTASELAQMVDALLGALDEIPQ
jgi:adenosylmethionine---8-amino-7-oxononanoate aminotransferase